MDEQLSASATDESTPTTRHKSPRSARMELIVRGERRRVWTPEQKREIVAESLGPELTPTEVARKHAISSGQLYTWRQQFLNVQTSLITRSTPRFAEVAVTSAAASIEADPPPAVSSPQRAEGLIEIVLPGGVVVHVDAHVDGRALRRVLGALEGR
jgi:transposase